MRASWGKDLILVVALVAAGFVLAWARFRPYLGDEGFYSDGTRVVDVARADELRYAIWQAPEPLHGEVNSAGLEGRSTRSVDGRWLVFAAGERGVSADLFRARFAGGAWVDVEALTGLNSPFDEVAPHFADGELLFSSNRPGGAGGLDLYRVPFDGERFGEAERLDGSLHSEWDETDPARGPDGQLAFASNRGEAADARRRASDHDLFLASPTPSGKLFVEPLGALNSPFEDRDPVFGLDGRALLFASDREGGEGGYDLYRSGLGREGWTQPRPLEGLCSPLDERAPDPEPDGFELRFVRSGGGEADLFAAESLELFHQPGRPIGWREISLLIALFLLAFLAWAARHWRAMDVLFRCYLVSLLVHLLIAMLLQRVHPKPSEVVPEQGPTRLRVRLMESPENLAARAERGGALEVTRAARASAFKESAPVGELPEAPRAQATVVEPVPSESFELAARERAGAAELPAPGLVQSSTPAREALRSTAPMGLAAPDESFHRPSEDVVRFDPLEARRWEVGRTGSDDQAAPPAQAVTQPSFAPPAKTQLAVPAAPRIQREQRDDSRGESASVGAAPEWTSVAERSAEETPRAARSLEAPAGPQRTLPGSTGAADPGVAQLDVRARQFQRSAPSSPTSSPATAPAAGVPLARSGEPTSELQPGVFNLSGRSQQNRESQAGADSLLEPVSFDLRRGSSRSLDIALVAPDPEAGAEPASSQASGQELQTTDSADTLLQSARQFSRPALGGSDRDALAAPQAPSVFHANPVPTSGSEPGPEPIPLVARAAPDSAAPEAPMELGAVPEAPMADNTPQSFSGRRGPQKLRALEELGGSTETEFAVARGLAYLSETQAEDGYWGSPTDDHDKYGFVAVGKTALVTLAYLGAGHTPESGSEHSAVVERAIRFLLAVQGPESGHFGDTSSYSHAIATYALAEAFAMEPNERLRGPLQRAIAHILENQTKSGDRTRRGGWGYYRPAGRHVDEYPRTSITAWQVMALESARLGGLEVREDALAQARSFLQSAWDPREGYYRYSHDPQRLRSGWPTLPGSTPAAMFALSVLGEDLSSPKFAAARSFLLERMPTDFLRASDDAFVENAGGNLYFVYYGSLAMLRSSERDWQRWNAALQGFLLPSQNDNGSWAPISVYARDYAGDDPDDLSYTTAMAVLCLEVYYRYLTPLLER